MPSSAGRSAASLRAGTRPRRGCSATPVGRSSASPSTAAVPRIEAAMPSPAWPRSARAGLSRTLRPSTSGRTDRRSRSRSPSRRSVLPDVEGLKVLDRPARADLGQDGDGIAASILGTEEVDGLADDLLTGVAEHPLRGRVPARNDAVYRPPDDGIV